MSTNQNHPITVTIVVTAVSTALAMTIATRVYHSRYKKSEDDDDDEHAKLKAMIPPKSIFEFEEMAMKKLAPLSKRYFQYFSDQAVTATACRTFYNSIRLLPSILQGDVSNIDTTLDIFGETLDIPVLIAPSACHALACAEGEVATARGAGAAGVGYCYNFSYSSVIYTDVVKEPGVKWLHMYMFEERDMVQAMIETALSCEDCFSAIILTCDHPHRRVQGRTLPYFMRAKYPYSDLDQPFFPNQAATGSDKTTLKQLLDPLYMEQMLRDGGNAGGTNSYTLSWEDVRWIQTLVNGKDGKKRKKKIPIVAKGILSADDARKAMEVGVDAIVVSNHGGRQCDFAVPAIEALPVVAAAVQGKIPIFVDSGVRSSADIVRALCLGASGVMLGRPPLWALACEGSEGLERMLTVLKEDLKDDMRSLGVTSISQLGMKCLFPPDQERIAEIVSACGEKLT
mmetsp:Transcript_10510/g.19234  ORF Transcript_10510/g.19234 Transcript_10510/m.19234 type:complete len:455 (-) Transcript_10510:1853-3217(-)